MSKQQQFHQSPYKYFKNYLLKFQFNWEIILYKYLTYLSITNQHTPRFCVILIFCYSTLCFDYFFRFETSILQPKHAYINPLQFGTQNQHYKKSFKLTSSSAVRQCSNKLIWKKLKDFSRTLHKFAGTFSVFSRTY